MKLGLTKFAKIVENYMKKIGREKVYIRRMVHGDIHPGIQEGG